MSPSYAAILLSLIAAIHASASQRQDGSIAWASCNMTAEMPTDCATFKVPLDYTNQSTTTLALQLLRVKAFKEPFKGSVLFNPGGPGGSGVDHLLKHASTYNRVLDGHFDLVIFDPRGTGRTIPFTCNFTSDDLSSASGSICRNEIPEHNMTEALTSGGWEEAEEFARICYNAQQETGSYLSTAFVARDMAQIVDALGEDGMLRFWGTSYGTVLGMTFAAMFPDKVDRMFLDSVVNPHDYMTGLWATAMLDTEKSLTSFFSVCLDTPSLCPLSNIPGIPATPEDLKSVLADILKELWESQQTIPAGYNPFTWQSGYVPTTLYHHIKRDIFHSLYAVSLFPGLANNLAHALSRNFTIYEQNVFSGTTENGPVTETYNLGSQSYFGVACSDAYLRASSAEEMIPHVQTQQASSPFAESYLPQMWACPAWQFQPAERYEGDFQATTNYPILFSNGVNDPATPMDSAINATMGFEGSVLLTHKGHGHGITGHPSNCSEGVVRAYFLNGTLPEVGTECEPNTPAFELAYAMLESAEVASNSSTVEGTNSTATTSTSEIVTASQTSNAVKGAPNWAGVGTLIWLLSVFLLAI